MDQIEAGDEWDGWYDFKSGAQYIHETGDLTHIDYPSRRGDGPYLSMSTICRSTAIEQIGAFAYHSWLDGGAIKQVLILKRK